MKVYILILVNFLIYLVSSLEYQSINLLEDRYKSYINQLEKDVSLILDGYSNKDIYSIQDIVNSTIYDDNIRKSKNLDTWVVVRTHKYYNITHMYHFQYQINEDNSLKFITGKDEFNILESWLQESDAINIYNLIDTLKSFLCNARNKCGEFDLTKKTTKNPNQGCWKTDIKMALYGDIRTSLMGCYLTEEDTNLTYHVSVYNHMNSVVSINKTISFYFMDYKTYEQKVYLPNSDTLDKFSINNEMTLYADKKLQKLFDDNLINKPSGYKPFKPDEPNNNAEGLGAFVIFIIIFACSVLISVIGYFGYKYYKNRKASQSSSNLLS